jgi:hypothetical protein
MTAKLVVIALVVAIVAVIIGIDMFGSLFQWQGQ